MKISNKRDLDPIGRTEKKPFGIQHNPLDYYTPNYLSPDRMSSYSYQYSLALETGACTFLNIGSANSILKYLLEKNDVHVIDLDLDWNTKPNVSAALPFLPFSDKSIDVVMCFQILEHLPLIMFGATIKELKRVAKEFILLSLPDQTITNSQRLKYFIYKTFNRPVEWNIYKLRQIDTEHFWEIGHSNISDFAIVNMIKNENLEIIKDFRNQNNRFHHFFVVKV